MGKPECNRDKKEDVVQEEKRGTNDFRAEIRQQTKVSENILKSLQKCCLKENLNVLTKFIDKKSNKEIVDHLRGMRAVLQALLAQVPTPQGIEIKQSYMSFDDAFILYLGYSTEKTSASLHLKHEKKRFKELICHPDYGLCVYIVMDSYIVLKSDDVDIEEFIESLISVIKNKERTTTRLDINGNLIKAMLSSMDSKWDKNILRAVIALQRSRNELEQLDFNCHDIRMLTDQVVALMEEREQAKIAATDMTTLRIKED